mgnify:CR=1 FL=1
MGLEDFFSWNSGLFMMTIFVLTFMARKAFELFPAISPNTPHTKLQVVWEEVLLPIVPPVLGAGFTTLVPEFPYPEQVVSHGTGTLIAYGLSFGFISSVMWRILAKLIRMRTGIVLPEDPGALQKKGAIKEEKAEVSAPTKDPE